MYSETETTDGRLRLFFLPATEGLEEFVEGLFPLRGGIDLEEDGEGVARKSPGSRRSPTSPEEKLAEVGEVGLLNGP